MAIPDKPLISIITPTYQRQRLLKMQHANVMRQTMANFEWLIFDDSPAPAEFFTRQTDHRILYHHCGEPRLTIGEKRNWLASRARGEYIFHFDDDDFYAEHYLEQIAARFESGADAVKLSAFFVYEFFQSFFGYWDTTLTGRQNYLLSSGPARLVDLERENKANLATILKLFQIGYGFSYAYRRSLWEQIPFPALNKREDTVFLSTAQERGFKLDIFPDTDGLVLHILRADNASECYPQFVLPQFMLTKIFGPHVLPMVGG